MDKRVEDRESLAKQIMVGVLVCVFSVLSTLAFATGDSPKRSDVEQMIRESEQRTITMIVEIKADQKAILTMQQTLLAEQAKLSGRVESLLRK